MRLAAVARGRARHRVIRTAEPRPPGIDLASNDYLGLIRDPRMVQAAVTALHRYGTGAGASRVVTGTLPVHRELEDELATLTGQPTALVFATGYAANLGLLGAIGGPGTMIALDAHAHASLIDGARLSGAVVRSWPHNDLDALADLVRESDRRTVVVVESVYSVLGDAADLRQLAELCAAHDATLVVDEAHGLGVTGAGRGSVQAAGLSGADHVLVTATLSKALGAQGGVVLGSTRLREHLINTARTFLFDTGLAPAAAAAAAEACRIIRAEPERVAALRAVAEAIADGCGLPVAAGAVQSIPATSTLAAESVAARLAAEGVLVGCFRPPSVPDGVSRIRLTAWADLDPAIASGVARRVTALLAGASA